jgi:hypothetical protein
MHDFMEDYLRGRFRARLPNEIEELQLERFHLRENEALCTAIFSLEERVNAVACHTDNSQHEKSIE